MAIRGLGARILRALVLLVLVLLAVPVLLVGLYRFVDPPATPLMLLRSIEGEGWRRQTVPIEAVSPALLRAVLAAEDARFCEHWGLDLAEIRAAVDDWRGGDDLRGASTITQQTARNLVLWPGGGFVRKALELWPTLLVEALWPKRRILEVYLGIAEWGPGIYGVEAAAQARFGKPAERLSAREAALLAAVLPSPRRRDPARPTAALLDRASSIQARASQIPLGSGGEPCPARRQ